MNNAEMNKGMVAEQQRTYGYEEQEKIVRGWRFGSVAPRGLLLGQLHSIPKEGRVPEYHDEEWNLGY